MRQRGDGSNRAFKWERAGNQRCGEFPGKQWWKAQQCLQCLPASSGRRPCATTWLASLKYEPEALATAWCRQWDFGRDRRLRVRLVCHSQMLLDQLLLQLPQRCLHSRILHALDDLDHFAHAADAV